MIPDIAYMCVCYAFVKVILTIIFFLKMNNFMRNLKDERFYRKFA